MTQGLDCSKGLNSYNAWKSLLPPSPKRIVHNKGHPVLISPTNYHLRLRMMRESQAGRELKRGEGQRGERVGHLSRKERVGQINRQRGRKQTSEQKTGGRTRVREKTHQTLKEKGFTWYSPGCVVEESLLLFYYRWNQEAWESGEGTNAV